jgi:hypothetical protein
VIAERSGGPLIAGGEEVGLRLYGFMPGPRTTALSH